jgi:hypothetical protein
MERGGEEDTPFLDGGQERSDLQLRVTVRRFVFL